MRVYSVQCLACGQDGPRRDGVREAKAAFKGHVCPRAVPSPRREVGALASDAEIMRVAGVAVHRVYPYLSTFDGAYGVALSDALYGVTLAQRRYDPASGLPFTAYALIRAEGAVRDGQREAGHLSRREWAKVKAGSADGKVRYDELPVWARPARSLDAPVATANHQDRDVYLRDVVPTPCLGLTHVETSEYVAWLLSLVDGRDREVLVRYYLRGQTLLQIANWWRVTESRVCQVHRHALRLVRERAEAADGALYPAA